jgi:hypothetical protein
MLHCLTGFTTIKKSTGVGSYQVINDIRHNIAINFSFIQFTLSFTKNTRWILIKKHRLLLCLQFGTSQEQNSRNLSASSDIVHRDAGTASDSRKDSNRTFIHVDRLAGWRAHGSASMGLGLASKGSGVGVGAVALVDLVHVHPVGQAVQPAAVPGMSPSSTKETKVCERGAAPCGMGQQAQALGVLAGERHATFSRWSGTRPEVQGVPALAAAQGRPPNAVGRPHQARSGLRR